MPEAERSFAIVLNPASAGGRALRLLPEAEDVFKKHGLEYRVIETQSIDHARQAAQEAARQGEVIASMGGDGLVGALAGALRETDGVLAILPGGRGNDFARSLGMPRDIREASELAATGEIERVDLGEANGKTFAGIASTGFDAVANELADRVKLVRGNLVYAYAGIRTLAGWRPATFNVNVDGSEFEVTGYSVSVANSKAHGGGIYVAPHASLTDGQLEVVTVGNVGKLRALVSIPKLFAGRHLDLDYVKTRRAKTVQVSADRPFRVYADGEYLTDLPMTVQVVPAALRIVATRLPAHEPPAATRAGSEAGKGH